MNPSRTSRPSRQRGFTLIELMVVVAIVTVMLTVAVVAIRGRSYNISVYSFGEKISAELDEMLLRAVATRRWQRLVVDQQEITHLEAIVQGMAKPVDDDDWQAVRTLTAPREIHVYAVDAVTHLADADAVPAADDGLGATIDFAPDGAGQAATIFIAEDSDRERARVVVFQASGASYVFDQW